MINTSKSVKILSHSIFIYSPKYAKLQDGVSGESEYSSQYHESTVAYPIAGMWPGNMPYKHGDSEAEELCVIETFGQRIRINGNPEMDILGNAVHSHFAVDCDRLPYEKRITFVQTILGNWGIENSIDCVEIIVAGQKFTGFIDRHYEGYKGI